jgi:hypothetical protein
MQLYTREDVLKRAWIADSKQADLMIDAIAASYNGDVDQFNCIFSSVANLHWLSEAIKCYNFPDFDPNDFDDNDFLANAQNCLTQENLEGIILRIENIVGSLCGCSPSSLTDDSIPDIIKYTDEKYY